jgi:hypothetical protein
MADSLTVALDVHRDPLVFHPVPSVERIAGSPGLSETTALLPADAGTCTVLFKVAAGRWNKVVTISILCMVSTIYRDY